MVHMLPTSFTGMMRHQRAERTSSRQPSTSGMPEPLASGANVNTRKADRLLSKTLLSTISDRLDRVSVVSQSKRDRSISSITVLMTEQSVPVNAPTTAEARIVTVALTELTAMAGSSWFSGRERKSCHQG